MSLVSLLQAEERNKHTKCRDVALHEFVESRWRIAKDRLRGHEAIPTTETGTTVDSLTDWIVAQGISGSRSTGDNLLEYVISFDKTTCITSGYFSFSNEASVPSQLIERLRQAPELAVNPMLLPALANNAWASMMTKDCWIAHGIIRKKIEEETGLMKSYLKDHINISDIENRQGEKEQQARYQHIHEAIVSEHAYLCNGLSDYVKDDGEAILAKLKTLDDLQENACLQTFVERRIQNTRIDLQLRERLLGKLHMQLQVVCKCFLSFEPY
ncbi:MAG: hypothetical protein Q9160_009206 [Pyrenula sp. 1 TL-2023]